MKGIYNVKEIDKVLEETVKQYNLKDMYNNYRIIKNEQKFKDFIDWLPDLKESEQFYLCLFARSKYCKNIVHISSDKAQLKRTTSTKELLYRKVKQMEVEVGAYLQRDVVIPQEALALYITINPRDLWKATFNSLIHFAKCIKNNNKGMNPSQEAMSEIQKSKGTTKYVIFDLDSKYLSLVNEAKSCVNDSAFSRIETRGGNHLLIEVNKIEDKYKSTWYKNIKSIKGVDQCGDMMSPVPGCVQGDFTPILIK